MLELADLTVAYGQRRALEGVSLTVGDGEIVTLLGANGSGKSTTLRTISGLVRPSAGRVRWNGQDIHRWPADAIVGAGIGHVPEGRDVFPEFTVLENLQTGAHTVARRDLAARLEAAYQLFPTLRERRRQRAGTLSGGEQQMLAIARALMIRPKLLLLDEPSAGLSPVLVDRVLNVMSQLKALGTSVLLVEQLVDKALAASSRVYALVQGRVALEERASEPTLKGALEKAYLGGPELVGRPA